MRTVIAGGHGQIGMRLATLLAARGDQAVGLVRNPSHIGELTALGADGAVCDLESASAREVAALLRGADAAVFAAGAGPGSGAARKETVDRDACVLLADAAEAAGVRRFVVVSAMRVEEEPLAGTDPVFAAYLRAKRAADDDVRARSGLDWTVLRPGRLTDDAGTGSVRLGEATGRSDVPRDDVAAVLLALLDAPGTAGRTLELVAGQTPVADAVAEAARA